MSSHTTTSSRPIGVFDSGMGGLTVLRELQRALPHESFIYLGDTARLPYGTKSPETVIRYAMQMTHCLMEHDIKYLVVACNTASATALNYLQEQFRDLPITGVIKPGARAAVNASQSKHIAVLATESTVNSNVYATTIRDLDDSMTVTSHPCSLFVALAEEGFIDNAIAKTAVKHYLTPIVDASNPYDCIVLGCTHFPVLSKTISEFVGAQYQIIDSAHTTAQTVKEALSKHNLDSTTDQSSVQYYVTDLPERFIRVGQYFTATPIDKSNVQLIDNHRP